MNFCIKLTIKTLKRFFSFKISMEIKDCCFWLPQWLMVKNLPAVQKTCEAAGSIPELGRSLE